MYKILDLVDLVNKKFSKDEIDAKFHMTRHELRVQVFDNGFIGVKAHINERVRYFNTEKAEPKLRDLHLKLHAFLDDML